jgi:hypothetical protein
MDTKYKLTASEFAQLLGISTSAVRKQRLAGKLNGQFIEKDSKYFYASPRKDRPNKVQFTAHNNPKFHGSQYKPKRRIADYYKKKNRDVPYDETRYGNAHNGAQLKLTNDLRQVARIQNKLKASELEHLTDDVVLEVKRKLAQKKADQVQEQRNLQQGINFAGYSSLSRAEIADYDNTKGWWYNHRDKKYEFHGPRKKKYRYYS